MCAGAGHKTYIPMALSSAPFGFVNIRFGFLGIPAIWIFLASLAAKQHTFFLPFLWLHYTTGVVLDRAIRATCNDSHYQRCAPRRALYRVALRSLPSATLDLLTPHIIV
jgi:hypothetical protein